MFESQKRAEHEYWPKERVGTDYEAIDAEFNRSFWAGRAEDAHRRQAFEREMWALKGQQVEVVKGRKVPLGTKGEVFWVGEGQYGWRVGVKDAEGETHWTAASNVEPVKQEVEV